MSGALLFVVVFVVVFALLDVATTAFVRWLERPPRGRRGS